MNFEFATATQIIFGAGALSQLKSLAPTWGGRALLVTGKNAARAALTTEYLREVVHLHATFTIGHEPTVDQIAEGVNQARQGNCDLVVSVGGGSVIDGGKAIAALATNPGKPLDYLEVIGGGKALTADPLPFIAIPTTAGTGAEVTRNAVLASPAHRTKVSLRHRKMLPDVALVDPTLTHSVPPALTAATGLDALTQLIEPYVTHFATPITDSFCREGIRRAARSLRRAFRNGSDAEAREDVALSSLFGGLALANAKLGAVHGFAGPIGGMYQAPHGAVCGRLLPFATAMNVQALREREPANPALKRYDEVARILTGDRNATSAEGVSWLRELCADLAVPGLATHGIQEEDFADVVAKARNSSSMKGNPIALTEAELREVLNQAL